MTNVTAPLSASAVDSPTAERVFRRAFIATAVLKFILSVVVPFKSDEAYFVVWGRHPDYGYYDHGAMTGWWLWVMLQIGDSAWLMRLPAVLVSQFVGWSLWRMLRPIDAAKAGWAATLYLVSPVSLFSFLITTDTPLLFFSVVAVMFTLRGLQHGRLRDYFLAGLALGFAFLSKYFAVLLGGAFAVLLLACVGRPRVRELAVLLSGIIPGVGINVAWNYHHSWVNILFNFYTRQQSSVFSVVPPLLFLAILAVLAGPGVLRALVWRRTHDALPARAAWRAMQADGTVVFAVVFALPLAVFLAVAFVHEIGVHWVLSFYPFLAAGLFACFGADGLRRMIRPTAIYTAVPVALALILPFLPVEWAQKHRSALSIVLAARPGAVLAELAPYRPKFLLTTPSYAKSALLGFHDRSNVPVLGVGSFHARQDDLITDLRTFDGRDVMIVSDEEHDFDEARTWFKRTEMKSPTVSGVTFRVLLGEGFNYGVYREKVLQSIADRYYRMPSWLQRFAAPGYFCERYGVQPRPLP